MKIYILIIIVSLLNQYSLAQDFVSTLYPNMSDSRVGFVVVDFDNDSLLCNLRGQELFAPASNTKLFTTALAYLKLDPGFRWKTPVLFYGDIKSNGTYNGAVVIEAGGDPSLSSIKCANRHNVATTIFSNFNDLGVKTFKGDIRILNTVQYESHTPADWLFDDMSKPWGAGVFALNFNDNILWYEGKKRSVMVWDTTGVENVFFAKADDVPGRTILNYLYDTLERSDIRFVKKSSSVDIINPIISDTMESVVLDDVVAEINYESRNMWSEALLLEATTPSGTLRRFSTSADTLSVFWQRILGERRIYFHDGSGLSPYNSVSPVAITSLLKYMAESDYHDMFLHSLPKCGEGTLDDMTISLSNGFFVRMKSGAFTRVRCYSGYVLDSDEEVRYIFSLMVNGFSCSHKEMKSEISSFLKDYFDDISD